jgi:hypothetical protein
MSIPQRNEQTNEQPEELTTADVARGKRPTRAAESRPTTVVGGSTRTERVSTEAGSVEIEQKPATETDKEEIAQLFPNTELADFRKRWDDIQTGFVDEPRSSVEQAERLVASAMKRLAEVFADERSKLEKQWDRGGEVSTEDLRMALKRYRSFFHRLLSI